jgi:hypothetical protein
MKPEVQKFVDGLLSENEQPARDDYAVAEEVIRILETRGLIGYWEHPGWINVPRMVGQEGPGLAVGTVNGDWGAQEYDADGFDNAERVFQTTTTLPITASPQEIADMISAVFQEAFGESENNLVT